MNGTELSLIAAFGLVSCVAISALTAYAVCHLTERTQYPQIPVELIDTLDYYGGIIVTYDDTYTVEKDDHVYLIDSEVWIESQDTVKVIPSEQIRRIEIG